MELELLLFGSSSVPVSFTSLEKELLSSVPVISKLELVPEIGTSSSVTQHHWLCPHLKIDCMRLKVTRSVGVLRGKDGSGIFYYGESIYVTGIHSWLGANERETSNPYTMYQQDKKTD